jgi:hypothetical protein
MSLIQILGASAPEAKVHDPGPQIAAELRRRRHEMLQAGEKLDCGEQQLNRS